ncbi:MAG: hypothetical protein ACTSXL_05485 [Alphaproteobacteria bacterium]|nr:MAG: hypothetical protein B6I23_00550 [Rickettsiaceae bacterium 4572_127]
MNLKAFENFLLDLKISDFDASAGIQKTMFEEYKRYGTTNKELLATRRDLEITFNNSNVSLFFEKKRIAGQKKIQERLEVDVSCKIDFHGRKQEDDKRKTWSIRFFFDIHRNLAHINKIIVKANSHKEDAEDYNFAEFVFKLVNRKLIVNKHSAQERRGGLKTNPAVLGDDIGTKNINELPQVLITRLNKPLKKYFKKTFKFDDEKQDDSSSVIKTVDVDFN